MPDPGPTLPLPPILQGGGFRVPPPSGPGYIFDPPQFEQNITVNITQRPFESDADFERRIERVVASFDRREDLTFNGSSTRRQAF